MWSLLVSPEAWLTLLTLASLEIVLGIDNIIIRDYLGFILTNNQLIIGCFFGYIIK